MYSSLALSIFAIATASQQIVALQRLDCYEHGLELIRNLLSINNHRTDDKTDMKPIKIAFVASYHWQMPVMLQGHSLYLFLLAMGLFAYHEYGIDCGIGLTPQLQITVIRLHHHWPLVGRIICYHDIACRPKDALRNG
ncbi:hypothetical protein P170DRAFT_430093 [Aspergillus steynii IBT 23096]|uniref:Secreted protein n=1 Tax=Aspergillus steynii IBT 23096 TaxID=1392250 RepID=A0A2I2FU91_9EURO|nr:uncharacterized protein P170DRAFT_430093 [Aspergillus steynii IBT 23096]PLB44184.1 hypothetical protein P170DRAFT_430093 [Aspergillus steynii IBT 23096]